MTKIAAIDIGTNTALLLVAEVTKQNEIIPIAQEEKIVRLGQGVDRNEYLNSEAIGRTLRAIREQVGLTINFFEIRTGLKLFFHSLFQSCSATSVISSWEVARLNPTALRWLK